MKQIIFFFLLSIIHCTTSIQTDIKSDSHFQCNFTFETFHNLCEDELSYLKATSEHNFKNYNNDELLTVEYLKQEQDLYGYAFSLSSFANKLLNRKNYLEYESKLKVFNQSKSAQKNQFSHITIVLIPGLFYKANQEIGGDGRQIIKLANELGFKSDTIQINPIGSLLENSNIICDYLNRNQNQKKILITISKGSADLKEASFQCHKEFMNDSIISWINLAGLNKGSHLINEIDKSFMKKLWILYYSKKIGFSYNDFLSLKVGNSNYKLNKDLSFGEKFRIINFIPFPLERHVTELAYDNFIILSRYGINDGLSLLGDSFEKNAINIPVWGVDHYLKVQKNEWNYFQKILIYEANTHFSNNR
jgi:hypothetical protein